jgi:hypothetical protein
MTLLSSVNAVFPCMIALAAARRWRDGSDGPVDELGAGPAGAIAVAE